MFLPPVRLFSWWSHFSLPESVSIAQSLPWWCAGPRDVTRLLPLPSFGLRSWNSRTRSLRLLCAGDDNETSVTCRRVTSQKHNLSLITTHAIQCSTRLISSELFMISRFLSLIVSLVKSASSIGNFLIPGFMMGRTFHSWWGEKFIQGAKNWYSYYIRNASRFSVIFPFSTAIFSVNLSNLHLVKYDDDTTSMINYRLITCQLKINGFFNDI